MIGCWLNTRLPSMNCGDSFVIDDDDIRIPLLTNEPTMVYRNFKHVPQIKATMFDHQ